MSRARRYFPEVRERRCGWSSSSVLAVARSGGRSRAMQGRHAAKIGCKAERVRRHEGDHGRREGPSTAEQDRVKSLEREVRELRQANEILRKASAYFAMAELDRPLKR